jgi:hypothetical protein
MIPFPNIHETLTRRSHHRAEYILKAMGDEMNNILWIDFGAEIMYASDTFHNINESNADMAISGIIQADDSTRLYTNTIWIRNTDKMKLLVAEWVAENEKVPQYDHLNLYTVLARHSNINYGHLPTDACYIVKDKLIPRTDSPLIIQHPTQYYLGRDDGVRHDITKE